MEFCVSEKMGKLYSFISSSFGVLGRSQAALCSLNGKVIAMGGGDSWQCLNTVEVYDPSENKWTYHTPMATARRGAGVAVFKGQLYLCYSYNSLIFRI